MLYSLTCFGQTFSQKDFEPIPLPNDRSPEWYRLDTSSDKAFSVTIFNKRLIVRQDTESAGKIYLLPEGQLMSLSMGEWGGGLMYKPKDSTLRYLYVNGKRDTVNSKYFNYKTFLSKKDPIPEHFEGKQLIVIFGDVHQVFAYKDSILIAEEINNLEKDYGVIVNLSIKKDIIKYSVSAELDDAPYAAAVYKNTIFIATLKGFYAIENGKVRTIFKNLSWYGFNPNSLAVIDKNHIYVGMHCGYAMIDVSKNSLVFYKHKYTSN